MGDNIGVLVFSEIEDVAYELLGMGRTFTEKLDAPLAVVLIGKESSADDAAKMYKYGADNVYSVTDPKLESYKVEQYTDALQAVVEKTNPRIILIGQTKQGGELAPMLAARLRSGCAVGCSKLELNENNNLVTQRTVLGGNATAVEEFLTAPQIATVAPKVAECLEIDESRAGEVIAVEADIKDVNKNILSLKEGVSGECKIEDASVIVSGGRGFKNKEDFELIKGLAKTLNGEMGCSRPIAADLKWLSVDHWVGLSGHKVKPKVYIACGISGQIQHLAGMRDSNTIIAINKDKDAPIFNAVDYGLVGDIYNIIPKLTEELKKG